MKGTTLGVCLAALLALPVHAQAASGRVLRSLSLGPPAACTSTPPAGIAFDGQRLWVSCPTDHTVVAINPHSGQKLTTVSTGGLALTALAWDSQRGRLLGCFLSSIVAFNPQAPSQPPITIARWRGEARVCRALAYDQAADTVWFSGFRQSLIEYSLHDDQVVYGPPIGGNGSFPTRCSPVGLALGRGGVLLKSGEGTRLGCNEVLAGNQRLFGLARGERAQLVCDAASFRNTSALWTLDQHGNLQALKVGRLCSPHRPAGTSAPVVTSLTAADNLDLAPVSIDFGAAASVPDGDRVAAYEWSDAGNGVVSTVTLQGEHAIWLPAGVFHPAVRVIDEFGVRSAWVSTTVQLGDQPIAISAVPDVAFAAAGTIDGYTITITNPNDVPIGVGALQVHLPQRFTYVRGSTSGLTSGDPGQSYHRPGGLAGIFWARGDAGLPLVLDGHATAQLHFSARLPTSGTHAYDLEAVTAFSYETGYPRPGYHNFPVVIGQARNVATIHVQAP